MRRVDFIKDLIFPLLIAALLIPCSADSSPQEKPIIWDQTALYSGVIMSLAIDPQNSDTIYAGTREGDVFKSGDGGQMWNVMNKGLTDSRIYSLAIGPQNPDIIYAGTWGGGIFISRDAGNIWSASSEGLTALYVYSLVIDPQNPSTVYAGTLGGVFKSENFGTNWKAINKGLTNIIVYSLAIDPNNPEIIYAATYGGGIFKSNNGGEDWITVNKGLSNTFVYCLAIDPKNPNIVYAGTQGSGVFKSIDKGASWDSVNKGLTSTNIYTLAIDPIDQDIIYAGTDDGKVFKSINGGSRWDLASEGMTNTSVYDLIIDPKDPKMVYAGTNGGIFKSEDKGLLWRARNEGLSNTRVYSLAIDPQDPKVIYVGTWGGGVFKSGDGGESWDAINEGLTNTRVYCLAIDHNNPNIIYAGTLGGGVFKSINRGATWNVINKGLTSLYVYSLVIYPLNSDIIYVATRGGTIFKSYDRGNNWSVVGKLPTDIYSLAISPNNYGKESNIIYAGAVNGEIFKAVGGGENWIGISGATIKSRIYSIAINLENSDIIYAGTYGEGIFRSKDGGVNWEKINKGLEDKFVHTLLVDPGDPSTLYAGTWKGVFRSDDGGDNWIPFSEGLTNNRVYSLAIARKDSKDSKDSNVLYAGTWGGIFRRNETWETISSGLTNNIIYSLAIDPNDPTVVYAGTYGNGVFKSFDRGITWNIASESLKDTIVYSLMLDPQDPMTIYAGTESGVLKSNDGGHDWESLCSDLLNSVVYSLAVDPNNTNIIYAGTYEGEVCRIEDGKVKKRVSLGKGVIETIVYSLVVDSKNPDIIYAGTSGGIFKSEDRGEAWRSKNEGLANIKTYFLVSDTRQPNTLYAGVEGGIYKSTDGGESWRKVVSGYVRTLAIDRSNPKVVYAGSREGMLISLDRGETWQDGGLSNISINHLTIDPENNTLIYAATDGLSIWRGQVNPKLVRPLNPLYYVGSILLFLIFVGGPFFLYFFVARPNNIHFITALKLPRYPKQLILALGGRYVERSWGHWEHIIEEAVLQNVRVSARLLKAIPGGFREYALERYYDEHKDEEALSYSRGELSLRNADRARPLLSAWEKMMEVLPGKDSDQLKTFQDNSLVIIEVLSSVLGLRMVEEFTFKRMFAYVVEAPTLRLRVPPRFPVIFIQREGFGDGEIIVELAEFMNLMEMSDFFALLVVLEDPNSLVNNVVELGRLIDNSPYSYDFIILGRHEILNIIKVKDTNIKLVDIILDQVELSLVSPFVTRGPVPDNMFFGRNNELKTITQTIKNNDFILVGGRRIGKTSILHKVNRRFTADPRYHSFYLDCQPVSTYEDFFDMLGAQLEKDFAHNLSGFRKLIREVKGELGDKLLILLLDEVDSIATYDTRNNEALFKLMRSMSQEEICRYIFCGGKALYRRVHDPSSPFFNFGKEIILGCLDERSARESIERPMSDMGIELQEGEEIVDRILEVSSFHPNLVQSICERVIGNISERRITLNDVEEVISEADFHQYYKETVWGESNPLEKIVSLVMIDRSEFDLSDIQEELAKLGITDKRAIDEALVTLRLYPVFTRVGRGYRYTLGYFPEIVKESEDVEILLQSLRDTYRAEISQ